MSLVETSPSHRIALFSLNEPSDGLEFAPRLLDLGWKVVATQNVGSGLPSQASKQRKFLVSWEFKNHIRFRPRSIQK